MEVPNPTKTTKYQSLQHFTNDQHCYTCVESGRWVGDIQDCSYFYTLDFPLDTYTLCYQIYG